jgi:hypothetical protein
MYSPLPTKICSSIERTIGGKVIPQIYSLLACMLHNPNKPLSENTAQWQTVYIRSKGSRRQGI